ncbi:MAG TPA: GGDEF domain-containing protein [Candidatus Acidoferrales bacterium]|nr:GGDEF domain-containing protein [Candidatus Acidoferrales bacterium]
MKLTQVKQNHETGQVKKEFRWDLIGFGFAAVIAVILVFLLDTGKLAQWVAARKESKVDEILFVSILFIVGVSFLSIRKWFGLSSRLIEYEESHEREHLPISEKLRNTQRRDVIVICCAVSVAVLLVFLFDTGSLAQWIADHKDTKVDESIVAALILLVGLSFFSIRRWRDLSDQVEKYEELYSKTVKLNRESALLSELSDLLQSSLSSEEAHRLIVDRAQILFPGTSGAVCMTASSRDIVEVVAKWGEPALAESFFAPKDCWGLRLGRVHLVDQDPVVLACAHLGAVRPARAMCVPMMAHGEALGLLYLDTGHVGSALSPALLTEAEHRLAKTFAEQAALALANLSMREILRMQSVRDPLTGLYNRRYMEESLERELRRAGRKKSSLGVMMLDVDHFKRFNDTFGHETGDAVLRILGNLFQSIFRGDDIVCRYGGEEFTIILPDASPESACQRAEQLREAARQAVAQIHGQALDRVTLSIGVAAFPEDGSSGEALLRAADSALYRAKQEGRDRVVRASVLKSEPPVAALKT